jgi:hypothetical protein
LQKIDNTDIKLKIAQKLHQQPQEPNNNQSLFLSPAYYNQHAPLSSGECHDANIYSKGCKALEDQKYDGIGLPHLSWLKVAVAFLNALN